MARRECSSFTTAEGHELEERIFSVCKSAGVKEVLYFRGNHDACTDNGEEFALIDGVLYLQVLDASKASYGITNYRFAIIQLAQTTLRSEIGKMELDKTFESRDVINRQIVDALDEAGRNWGIKVLRYEVKSITPPESILRAMQQQITAEREKRAVIAKSEGERQQQINIAEGERQRAILESEGEKQAAINKAQGEATAIRVIAEANAAGVRAVAERAAYVTSKFAVVGLTQAMAAELASVGITVNSICPGYVFTEMQHREAEWEGSLRGIAADAVRDLYVNDTPLRRLEQPEDVAKVAVFLASSDSDFITGAAIDVNGGAHMA